MTTSIALEEYELLGDAKYRSFVTSVDKALKTFEYSSEWADLISALGKLNKVLLSHIKFSVIPRRITISKRLAQCLHPALPSGVHLRALETYDIIFKSIGTARLSQELFIYSAGLFPLLGNAAMNVRPVLLTIYESHFVPLGERLRPGLLGFLIGILPGLEEGSDHFERTDTLLMSVCNGVEKNFFYGCLWRCVLTNPGVRLPAITFVLLHLDKKKNMEDQLHLIGTDIDAMVQGMCAALQDASVLVQRCALDLLLLGFPLHNSQLVKSDRVQLLEAAVSVVLRRDMSLNRRLFAWLLGTDSATCPFSDKSPTSDSQSQRNIIDEDAFGSTEGIGPSKSSAYFESYSKDLLLVALQNLFLDASSSLMLLSSSGHISGYPILWPYRILISLLDRSEIGSHILEDILVEVFRALYREVALKNDSSSKFFEPKRSKNHTTQKLSSNHFEVKNKDFQKELVKTANLLFSTLEPSYLWEYVGRLFHKACVECEIQDTQLHLTGQTRSNMMNSEMPVVPIGLPTIEELCKLIAFLLEVINVETYQDTPTVHLPELLATLGSLLQKFCKVLTLNEFFVTFQLCSKLLSKAQPTMFPSTNALSSVHSRCKSTSSLDSNTTATSYSLSLRLDTPKSPLSDQISKEFEEKMAEGKSEQLCWISLDISPDPQEEELTDSLVSSNYVLSKAVKVFQDFIAVFIQLKLLSKLRDPFEMFQNDIVIIDQTLEREKELQHLLCNCLHIAGDNDDDSTAQPHLFNIESLPMKLKIETEINESLIDAFEGACQLLIEFAAFPVYLTSRSTSRTQQTTTNNFDTDPLPEWLKLLLIVGCLLEDRRIHLCALSALLELVALTHAAISITNDSSNQSFKSFPFQSEETGESVTCVVNIPMISEAHLQYLTQRTQFFALAASKLWFHIGQSPSELQLKAVDLLQQVHNLAPDHPCHGSVCDVVICEALSSVNQDERMEALKKFCILWHLTRDIRLKSNGGTALSRLFDRPLFLVLDQLESEPGSSKTIAESWLNHCLQRGDLARVLEPLLTILLHKDTARVSVQHVSVYCPMNAEEDNSPKDEDLTERDEAQIYAISSVGGNVIYHVSGANSCDSRPNSKHSSPEKKILALTSVVGDKDSHSSKFVTSHTLVPGYELPCSHERNLNHPISLFVNPFGSMSSLSSSGDYHEHYSHKIVPDLSNVRRINLKAFKKGYFDTMDSEESDDAEKKNVAGADNDAHHSEEPQTVEDFAKSILDDIITLVAGNDDKVDASEDLSNSKNDVEKDMSEAYQDKLSNSSPIIHPLHGYLLLYTQVYDSHKVLYMLSSFKSIILANPRLALWCMATTSVNQQAVSGSKGQDLQVLLARHRKSIFGNNFHGSLTSEAVTTYRSSMFVEVIVTTCLYYVRGVYPNLPKLQRWLTEEEVLGNRKVRLMALEVLTIVFSELVGIVKEGGRSVASYMNDLLNRCKVQKILLHCLTAGVFHSAAESSDSSQEPISFSKVIIDFNEETSEGETKSFQDTLQVGLLHLISKVIILEDTIGWLTATPTATPGGDLREGRTASISSSPNNSVPLSKSATSESKIGSEKSKSRRNSNTSSLAPSFVVKYQIGVPIPAQPMFLTSILTALRQMNLSRLHSHWLSLVMATLPFTGGSGSKALSHLVISVVSQLCLSLDSLAKKPLLLNSNVAEKHNMDDVELSWPPDYLINMVESLTTICHFCLLDSPASTVASAASATPSAGTTSPAGAASHSISTRTAISQLTGSSSYASGINASQIISNLLHVFSPSDILNKDFVLGPDGASGAGAALEALLAVRRTLLGNLPRIMATLTALWRLIGETNDFNGFLETDEYRKGNIVDDDVKKKKHKELLWTMGSPKVVRQHILSFLSPLSVHYGSHFMAAVSAVWHDYRPHKNRNPPHSTNSSVRKIFPIWSRQQQQLVELVKAIKVLPFESIVQTVRQVLKQHPTTVADQKRVPLEVSLLQFFLAYMQTSNGSSLVESWPSLLVLWREGLQLSATPSSSGSTSNLGSTSTVTTSPLPIVQLHLLALLHEFVQKAPMLEDKRDQRDLQEVAQKLVDVCSEIAGSSLEQTNWLRRNLAVRPGPQPDLCDEYESDCPTPEKKTPSELNKATKSEFGSTGNISNGVNQISTNAQYSVQALQCLAEFLAPIMDVVYVSEEKEKVVSLLNNIMYYVTPYLKNHSVHNTPSFRACSQLLASISGYQYTRKAWKKDAFDLLLDSSFFQMEGGECLSFWRQIIDHLMTHDKMTYRDFLARVCITQSGSLSIFSSREQEHEQRSQLLKRLAFVLFCSEMDQYQKYMPDIQERLAECLRLPQVPSIQSQVFLCFRVLLIRISPDHMTSLWPNIITEMVQVFLQMEQELSTETEQFSSHIQRISLLDSSWVVHSGNGLHAHNNPAWLQLYLSVCKLLDMVICLPANMLPQFQMYRWAFVADSPPVSSSELQMKEDRTRDPSRNGLKSLETDFVPHIARLAALLNNKATNGIEKTPASLPTTAKFPLLRMNVIKSLMQLQPFFNSLAMSSSASSVATPSCSSENNLFRANNSAKENCSIRDMLKLIENVMESDFIEPQS